MGNDLDAACAPVTWAGRPPAGGGRARRQGRVLGLVPADYRGAPPTGGSPHSAPRTAVPQPGPGCQPPKPCTAPTDRTHVLPRGSVTSASGAAWGVIGLAGRQAHHSDRFAR